MATNFTTLALYVSGLKDIVVAKAGALGSVTAFALLIVIVVSALLVLVDLYTIAPNRASTILGSASEWLERNNHAISLFFLAFFGALLFAKGFSGLLNV